MELTNLVEDIKSKKELKDLSSNFVLGLVMDFIKNEKIDCEKLENKRSKEYKNLLKGVRKILREVYGVFKLKNFLEKELLLEDINSLDEIEAHAKILELHKSTKERLPYYFEIYGHIMERVDKVETVLDLGAGLNPLSIPFMDFKVKKYYAIDVAEKDAKFLNSYFKKVKINGYAEAKDLTKVEDLPKVDICFMFKLLDTLETLKRDISKVLLSKIKANWLVVSFSTTTIGGKKKISKDRLTWFKKLISKYEYDEFVIPNEVFFVIKLK